MCEREASTSSVVSGPQMALIFAIADSRVFGVIVFSFIHLTAIVRRNRGWRKEQELQVIRAFDAMS